MKLILAAVGQKLPAWADTAYEDYAKRFPPDCRRQPRGRAASSRARSAAMLIDATHAEETRVVVLDERGSHLTTTQLAERLLAWQRDGRDVALLVGGPDGLDPALREAADERIRLSDLTLPHVFVRVMLAEALYRAWSVTVGHPYHRE